MARIVLVLVHVLTRHGQGEVPVIEGITFRTIEVPSIVDCLQVERKWLILSSTCYIPIIASYAIIIH